MSEKDINSKLQQYY
jgi:uncharacterized protein YukE